jgi:hypothetical protein
MGGRAGHAAGPSASAVRSGGGKPVGSLAKLERSNRAWNSQAARSQAMSVNDSVADLGGALMAPPSGRPQRAVVLAWRCSTSRSSGRAEKRRWSMLAFRRRAA